MISRSPNPILSIDVGERVYVADVDYPMAVVGTAGRGLIIYNLENQPKEYKRVEPPLKYQHRCISSIRCWNFLGDILACLLDVNFKQSRLIRVNF